MCSCSYASPVNMQLSNACNLTTKLLHQQTERGSFLGKHATTSSARLAGRNLCRARRAAGEMLFWLSSLTKLQRLAGASPFPKAQRELFPSLRVPSGEGRKQERLWFIEVMLFGFLLFSKLCSWHGYLLKADRYACAIKHQDVTSGPVPCAICLYTPSI